MEINTVTISLEDYNELRDFKEKIKSGSVCRIYKPYEYSVISFIGIDDALLELNKELERLQKENDKLGGDKPRIESFNSMNWWQFRKWKANKF